MRVQNFDSPAKINLSLHVLGKRTDGYHDLSMIMQRISLCDKVSIRLGGMPGCRVDCPALNLPAGTRNIAERAAVSMLEYCGYTGGVEIYIDKHIPVAAGLGGGSSNAATVLLGLKRMLSVRIDRDTLIDMAVRLGADVPFFVLEQDAWARGIGEDLEVVEGLPDAWYLLVNPGFGVSTAGVFAKLNLTSKKDVDRVLRFPRTLLELVDDLHNDLEAVTVGLYPALEEIRQKMLDCGASGVLMSGSGATMFGVFDSETSVQEAYSCLQKAAEWWVFVARPYGCA